MYYHITEAAALRDYAIHLKFEDGLEGVIALDRILDKSPLFKELKNSELFRRVTLDKKWHTITWPNGVDLAPDVLYDKIKKSGKPVVEY
ncbi:MAG: DUF2442 domain-containing protein [Alphaproteobacteria bacterium]|nr:DUF2442 domain-containing protein [Alphaproteobacteria bacterium]